MNNKKKVVKMKLLYQNNKKTIKDIWGVEDCKDEYEIEGVQNYLAGISYSVYEVSCGNIVKVDNGGHGFWNWRVLCGDDLIGEHDSKTACLNQIKNFISKREHNLSIESIENSIKK